MLTTALVGGFILCGTGVGYNIMNVKKYKLKAKELKLQEKKMSEDILPASEHKERSLQSGVPYTLSIPSGSAGGVLMDVYGKYIHQDVTKVWQPNAYPEWNLSQFSFIPDVKVGFKQELAYSKPETRWRRSPFSSFLIHPKFSELGLTASSHLDLSAFDRSQLNLVSEDIKSGKDTNELLKSKKIVLPSLVSDETYKVVSYGMESQSIYARVRHYPDGGKIDMIDSDPVSLAQRFFAPSVSENDNANSMAHCGIALFGVAALGCILGGVAANR